MKHSRGKRGGVTVLNVEDNFASESVEGGGEWGGRVPLPSRLGGLGSVVSPGQKRIMVKFELENASDDKDFGNF